MKIAYKHIKKYIKEDVTIDELSASLFQLGHEHEIEGDIYDIEFTPNRGDCLSINGILRDLGVFYTVEDNKEIYNKDIDSLEINFNNQAKDICPKISFLKLEVDELPFSYTKDVNDYFDDLGLTKNNFFTDISNFLSYETGQPTHCYDAKKLQGYITLQETEEEIKFDTLLGKTIQLKEKNLVFLNEKNVINLAGIMGSQDTACTKDTKSVIVECAYFQPEAIIGKSIKYDLQSDAAYKFERGVNPNNQENVLRRFINIVGEHATIKKMSMCSFKYFEDNILTIPINENEINNILGINISRDQYLEYLCKLGFVHNDDFIEIPSYRSDVFSQNDLAEEIARIIGYDNIPSSNISIPKNNFQTLENFENKLRTFLVDNGFNEVINFPFTTSNSKSSIKIINPLDSNRNFLRINVTDSLVENLLYNERRQKDSIKLFEISDVYISESDNIIKKKILSIIATGRVGLNYKDFSKKIDIDYIANIFNKALPDTNLNFRCLPRSKINTKKKDEIIYMEINLDEINKDELKYTFTPKDLNSFAKYRPISEQPSSIKDISFSVEDEDKLKLLETLMFNFNSEILKNVFIFDYFKNTKKSIIKIGYRFTFQSHKKTLTDKEIDTEIGKIIKLIDDIDGIKIPGLS